MARKLSTVETIKRAMHLPEEGKMGEGEIREVLTNDESKWEERGL